MKVTVFWSEQAKKINPDIKTISTVQSDVYSMDTQFEVLTMVLNSGEDVSIHMSMINFIMVQS